MMNTAEVLHKIANKAKDLFNKVSLDEVIKTADISRNFFPDFKSILGTGITLINSEIKYIVNVIKSLENKGILLKETTRKITCQKGGFLNFLSH